MAVFISLVNFPGHFFFDFDGIGIFGFDSLNLAPRNLQSFCCLGKRHSILDDILMDQILDFRFYYCIGLALFVDKTVIFVGAVIFKGFFRF